VQHAAEDSLDDGLAVRKRNGVSGRHLLMLQNDHLPRQAQDKRNEIEN
jgi:hypothetical protein